ncbi:hypothetical protein HW561_09525 [Rhodobacteraceae bacterium B1Z28]|uniref:Uncharacterized protein n=1 Tax=Ruegeria haliotis TaxID=2747601 RepID=A0ABX2PQR7_9RHOB|nr:hypothetical protein [Ruegeria haliotis]NVO56026.1 hypothetical protein [Ruegeria haliotis]
MGKAGEQHDWPVGSSFRTKVVEVFDPNIVHLTKLLDTDNQHGVYRDLTDEVCYVQLTYRNDPSYSIVRCMGRHGAKELMKAAGKPPSLHSLYNPFEEAGNVDGAAALGDHEAGGGGRTSLSNWNAEVRDAIGLFYLVFPPKELKPEWPSTKFLRDIRESPEVDVLPRDRVAKAINTIYLRHKTTVDELYETIEARGRHCRLRTFPQINAELQRHQNVAAEEICVW